MRSHSRHSLLAASGLLLPETLLGGLVLVSALLSPSRALLGLYTAALIAVLLAVGASFMLALGLVSGAGWINEHQKWLVRISNWQRVASVAFFLLLIPSLPLFHWFSQPDSLPPFQRIWYHPLFYLLRALFYLTAWAYFSSRLANQGLTQSASPEGSRIRTIAAAFFPIFGVTFWLSSVDWVLSFSPDWQTTIFSFCRFSNLLLMMIAVLVLLLSLESVRTGRRLRAPGRFASDPVRFLFFAGCLWAYLWFCLNMLIWYAGVPAESSFILNRLEKSWSAVFLIVPILCWAFPFVSLMSDRVKKMPDITAVVAGVVLVGCWLDTYLMIFPTLESFGLLGLPLDIAPTLLMLALLLRRRANRIL